MDRVEASGASDAGSIPAEDISFMSAIFGNCMKIHSFMHRHQFGITFIFAHNEGGYRASVYLIHIKETNTNKNRCIAKG